MQRGYYRGEVALCGVVEVGPGRGLESLSETPPVMGRDGELAVSIGEALGRGRVEDGRWKPNLELEILTYQKTQKIDAPTSLESGWVETKRMSGKILNR